MRISKTATAVLIKALTGALNMKRLQNENHKEMIGPKRNGNRGASAVEMAIILPILVMMVFGAIDFGRLFHARLIMTNVAREGASLASRDIQPASQLITMLQAGSTPLDMVTHGKIFIWRIKAGVSRRSPYPTIDHTASDEDGSLIVNSTIGAGKPNLGLDSDVYQHLIFDTGNAAADIGDITVVEVFYQYRPITPVVIGNKVLSSRAVF